MKVKVLAGIFLGASFLAILLLFTWNQPFLAYESSKNLIKINYPLGWKIEEFPSETSNEVVRFSPPEADKSKETLSVSIEELPPSVESLEEYSNYFLRKATEFPRQGKVELLPITMADSDGFRIDYLTEVENDRGETVDLLVMQAWVVQSKKVYSISYATQSEKYSSENYSNFIEKSNKIISSFKINSK